MYAKRHLPDIEQWRQSSGSNFIPRRARPGLAGLRPHNGGHDGCDPNKREFLAITPTINPSLQLYDARCGIQGYLAYARYPCMDFHSLSHTCKPPPRRFCLVEARSTSDPSIKHWMAQESMIHAFTLYTLSEYSITRQQPRNRQVSGYRGTSVIRTLRLEGRSVGVLGTFSCRRGTPV